MKVHVINDLNRHLYADQWDQFLRLRHRYFVEINGWREPSPDGRETDQFDTPNATYLLAIDDGQVIASARVIPTSAPNMASDVFPHMCGRLGVPRRADWADWTRSFVVEGRRALGRSGTQGRMACAVMEYCLDEGIEMVGGIQQLYFLDRWERFGWDMEIAGMPERVGGEWCVVAYIRVTEEALQRGRTLCGLSGPIVERKGQQQAFVRAPGAILQARR